MYVTIRRGRIRIRFIENVSCTTYPFARFFGQLSAKLSYTENPLD